MFVLVHSNFDYRHTDRHTDIQTDIQTKFFFLQTCFRGLPSGRPNNAKLPVKQCSPEIWWTKKLKSDTLGPQYLLKCYRKLNFHSFLGKTQFHLTASPPFSYKITFHQPPPPHHKKNTLVITPPPPLVMKNHFSNDSFPFLAHDIICEQPLNSNEKSPDPIQCWFFCLMTIF